MSASAPRLYRAQYLEFGIETTLGTATAAYAFQRTSEPVDLSGLTYDAIENTSVRTNVTQYPRVLGPRGGSVTTKHYLHGYSSTLPVGAPSLTSHPLAEPLMWLFGYGEAGGYVSQDPAGSTTTILKGDDLSSFVVGQALAYLEAGVYHTGWAITNNAAPLPDELTVLQAMITAASTNPTIVYGSFTAAMRDGHGRYSAGAREAFTLRLTTHLGDERYTLLGCMPMGCKIVGEMGQIPTIEITWGVSHWTRESGVTAPTAGTYSYAEPEALMGANCTFGTDQATRYRIARFEFDLGLAVVPIKSISGVSGITGWAVTDRKPSLKFSVYRDPSRELTDFEAQTAKALTIGWGSQPGRMASLCFPNAVIEAFPGAKEEDGLISSELSVIATNYVGDTGAASTTNVIDSDCKLALL